MPKRLSPSVLRRGAPAALRDLRPLPRHPRGGCACWPVAGAPFRKSEAQPWPPKESRTLTFMTRSLSARAASLSARSANDCDSCSNGSRAWSMRARGRLLYLYDPEIDVTIGDGEPIRDIAAIWDVEVLSGFLGRGDLGSLIRRSLGHFGRLVVERDGYAIVAPPGEQSSIAHSAFLALALACSEISSDTTPRCGRY
jgi:hypothetical protein